MTHAILFIITLFSVSFTTYSNVNQFIKQLQKIEVSFIFLILFAFTIPILIKELRQLCFLKQIGIDIDFKRNILIYFTGLSMLVTHGSMGQVVKWHFLLKYYDEPVSKTLPVVTVERYHDVLTLFTL